MATDGEIAIFTTEFDPSENDSIEDILTGRLHYAINDQIENMLSEYFDKDEIKKIILRDVKDYIETYVPLKREENPRVSQN